jgi:hypothetical protein
LEDVDRCIFLGVYLSLFIVVYNYVVNIPGVFYVEDYFSGVEEAEGYFEACPIITNRVILDVVTPMERDLRRNCLEGYLLCGSKYC